MESTTPPEGHEPVGIDPATVCTLSTDGMADRLAWIREEIVPHTVETVRLDRGLAFEVTRTPGLAEKLDELIRLERDCCPGIVFERVASETPDRMRVEVRGIDPDAAVFQSLHVRNHEPAKGARLAKAAGVGVLGSVLVCCALPIAAVALLGGAAAPLLSLDSPGPIAAGALLAGSGAWWSFGRYHRGRAVASEPRAGVCGPDC